MSLSDYISLGLGFVLGVAFICAVVALVAEYDSLSCLDSHDRMDVSVKPKPKPHVPHPDMGDLAIHPKGSKAVQSGVGNQYLRVKLPRIRKGQ